MMTITRDVVRDLLVLCQAGDASADSRAIVDTWLRSDPELARQAEEARAGVALPSTVALPPSAEARTLERTRQLLRVRARTMAMAVFFTLLPLSFVFKNGRVTFMLIRDEPAIGLAWWAIAASLWVWHVAVRRRLRVTGL